MKRLLLLLIPLVLVVGCSDASDLEARLARLEAENASLKEVTQASTPRMTHHWVLLKVGDCYNGPHALKHEDPKNTIEGSHVESVSCDGPHTNEVYAVFELPDSSWKGIDYVTEQAYMGCKARYEAFVGIEYDLSSLWIMPIYPSERTWKEVDRRQVLCSVAEESGIKSGSAKGSRR